MLAASRQSLFLLFMHKNKKPCLNLRLWLGLWAYFLILKVQLYLHS